MLDIHLQILLLSTTTLFFMYIIHLVGYKKLELHYALTWLLSTVGLIFITVMPGAIDLISDMIHIKETVNTLFLVVISLIILIILSLTKALSKSFLLVNTLIQEVGLLKMEVEKLKNQN